MTSISIIIPVYNVEKYIEACLHSVMAQTYTGPMECILVDDCGQDNSIGVAEKVIDCYEGPIQFRILHHDHNRGQSAARNTGMDAATGEYIFFSDSDDELTADCIEQLVKALDGNTYDIVVGDVKTIGNNALNEYFRLKLDDGIVLRDGDIVSHYKSHWNMLPPIKLYNTAYLRQQQLRFKEGLIHEDELWSFEIACIARELKATQHVTYLYLLREISTTATTNKDQRKKIDAKITIVGEMTQFLRSRQLFSPPAYAIIQKFIEEILHYEKNDRQHFRRTYLQLRKSTRFPLLYRIRAKRASLRGCIQELHYFLPPTLGERYKYWRISK